MTEHIHEIYYYMGVWSCVNCPKQFTTKQVNNFKTIKVKEHT